MLELDLQYRNHEYLNNEDLFLCFDIPLKKLFISKMIGDKSKGTFFTNYGLHYKANTILVQNCDEIIGQNIKYKNIDYFGKICRVRAAGHIGDESHLGVLWKGGAQVKEHGLANYWTKLELLEFKIN